MTTLTTADHTLEIIKTISIQASPQITWNAMLQQISGGMDDHGAGPMNLRLEPFPGGRYFRDLGNNTGHLWAHVQVIKPPTLLELYGPLFMSFPAINHVAYRITQSDAHSTLTITHRAFGLIPAEHRKGIHTGWQQELDQIKQSAEKHSAETR
jgi:hypothetical protein